MEHKRAPLSFKFDIKPHVLVVDARFYADIGALQMQGVKAVLDRAGVKFDVLHVPGALEIPAAIACAFFGLEASPARRCFDGYIALGCVIKGGTQHDEIVGFESARALQDLSIRHGLAIGNGILTCNTHEQALERADPAKMDRAGAAAEAALRMIEIRQKFELTPTINDEI